MGEIRTEKFQNAGLRPGYNFKTNLPVLVCFVLYIIGETRLQKTETSFLVVITAILVSMLAEDLKKSTGYRKGISEYVMVVTGIQVFISGLYIFWPHEYMTQAVAISTGTSAAITKAALALCVLCGCIPLYIINYHLSRFLAERLREITLLWTCTKKEKIIWAVTTIVLFAMITAFFLQSRAFTNAGTDYDVIYTSDSPSMLEGGSTWTEIFQWHNSMKQPLFAVFSAPLMAVPCVLKLICDAFGAYSIGGIVIGTGQIVIMILTWIILIDCMNLSVKNRICIFILGMASYTTAINALMIEQYIDCCFWLILLVNIIVKNEKGRAAAVAGAGGCMLTSFAMLPWLIKDRREYLKKAKGFVDKNKKLVIAATLAGSVIVFLMAIIVIGTQSPYMGGDLSYGIRIEQFLSFFAGNFYAAPAIKAYHKNHNYWALTEPQSVFIMLGIIILVLCIVGFLVKRKDTLTQISAYWLAVSFGILVVVGWGTSENGLILYSLYFFWAQLVLIFNCIEKADYLNRWVVPVITGILAVSMICCNCRSLTDMLDFAVTYYPF